MRRLSSRHDRSETFIERSLELQKLIDEGRYAVDDMNIDRLHDLNLIDGRTFRQWQSLEAEQDELTRYEDFNPSLLHYEEPISMAEKNIRRLEKEVNNLISKSRSTLRQAKTAGAGAENARYLNSISPQKKMEILEHIASHYGTSVQEIEEEVTDMDAEKLFEYAASNNAMAMEIYRGMGRKASMKTAASGNYGFTKAVQNDVEIALRKLEKKVNELARRVESKHPEAGTYFGTRCQGSTCNASKALSGACLLNQKPKRLVNGPLGFKPSCAKASHKAITDLIIHAGDVAHTLFKKDRDHIPYLKTHAKKKRCPLTRLILENYPVEIL